VKSRALLFLALLVSLWPTILLADPKDGSVQVEVTNASGSPGSVTGDTVTLMTFGIKEQTQVAEAQATIDANGKASFKDLDRDANLAYWILVQHQGVTYPSATPFQLKDTTNFVATVRLFDATDNETALRFERVNLLISAVEPGLVHMLQMGAVVNESDRTYVTPNPQDGALARAVRFGLPPGSLQAQFATGFANEAILTWPGGVQSTQPLKPGRQEYAISFTVPYTGTAADLTLQLPYAAGTFNVYAPQSGVTVESSSVISTGTGNLGGQEFQVYTANELAKGTNVSVKLSGLPSVGGATGGQQTVITLGALAIAVLGGLGIYIARFRKPLAIPALSPTEERQELVQHLAELDQMLADGDLDEATYESKRAAGKARLLELAQQARAKITA
jgi:hypothetical protein